jgi:transposase
MKYIDNKNVENFHKFKVMNSKKERRVFSESFKKEKVKQIESGQLTIYRLSKMLELGDTAIYGWMKKYSTQPYKREVVDIETESDYLKSKKLEEEVKHLTRLLDRMHIKLDFYEELINEVNVNYGTDVRKDFLNKKVRNDKGQGE